MPLMQDGRVLLAFPEGFKKLENGSSQIREPSDEQRMLLSFFKEQRRLLSFYRERGIQPNQEIEGFKEDDLFPVYSAIPCNANVKVSLISGDDIGEFRFFDVIKDIVEKLNQLLREKTQSYGSADDKRLLVWKLDSEEQKQLEVVHMHFTQQHFMYTGGLIGFVLNGLVQHSSIFGWHKETAGADTTYYIQA